MTQTKERSQSRERPQLRALPPISGRSSHADFRASHAAFRASASAPHDRVSVTRDPTEDARQDAPKLAALPRRALRGLDGAGSAPATFAPAESLLSGSDTIPRRLGPVKSARRPGNERPPLPHRAVKDPDQSTRPVRAQPQRAGRGTEDSAGFDKCQVFVIVRLATVWPAMPALFGARDLIEALCRAYRTRWIEWSFSISNSTTTPVSWQSVKSLLGGVAFFAHAQTWLSHDDRRASMPIRRSAAVVHAAKCLPASSSGFLVYGGPH